MITGSSEKPQFYKFMRSKTLKLNMFIVLILGFVFSGCDYKLRETPRAENTKTAESNASNANLGNVNNYANASAANEGNTVSSKNNYEGGKLTVSDTGRTATLPCNRQEIELDENATANTLTFTGECKKLTVNGVSNKIFVEKVGEIIVTGISNKITYGEGISGKKPKITKSGTHTDVYQKGSAEEKKATESKQ